MALATGTSIGNHAPRESTSLNRYKSSSTQSTDTSTAVEELLNEFPTDTPPTLLVVFASSHFEDQLQEIAQRVNETLQPQNTMGCTGESIVADELEIEGEPCISIWAAWWPDASINLSHVTFDRENANFVGLPDVSTDSSILLLADPFSFPADVLLAKMNEEKPGTQMIGGMASGASRPGEAKLVFNEKVLEEGCVLATLSGVPITCVVSQGCRPIGEPYVITKAERNVIYELGGKRAHDQLKTVYDRLPTRDKELMRMGIHLGRVVNEYQESFDYGDFLMRNITGFDPEDASISVGDFYRAGQTVQFHLRDAISASHDLEELLKRNEQSTGGALLFTCNGRGTRLFEDPHHDAGKVRAAAGEVPCAGFFCAGEIGPIGGQNFLHGFTASVALFK